MRRDLAGSWFDKATPFLRRGHDFDLESSVGKSLWVHVLELSAWPPLLITTTVTESCWIDTKHDHQFAWQQEYSTTPDEFREVIGSDAFINFDGRWKILFGLRS